VPDGDARIHAESGRPSHKRRSWRGLAHGARFPRFVASVREPIRGGDGPRVEHRVLWGWQSGGG
jgi:hypothetical protein